MEENVSTKTLKISRDEPDKRVKGQEWGGCEAFQQQEQHVQRSWGENMAWRKPAQSE